MKKIPELMCSYCDIKACASETEKEQPVFCPMTEYEETIKDSNLKYTENENDKRLALESARIEAEGYCKWTRIEETLNFAKRLGAKRIGIAHCEGLMKEAQIVHKIFKSNGFQVNSVCCKVGNLDKIDIGLIDEEKVHPGQYESACNPISQAKILEKAGSEFNIVIGLCVGHDSLFFLHSKVPATVLIVKDRVLGHNPVAALYTTHSYYKHLKKKIN